MNEIHVIPILSYPCHIYRSLSDGGKISKFLHKITYKLRFVVLEERAKRIDRQIDRDRESSIK